MSHFLMAERNLRVFVPKSVEMRVICSLQYFCCFGDRLELPLGLGNFVVVVEKCCRAVFEPNK